MDRIDSQIIALLHDNARIPISEISRIIAMSQPAVTERVRKLEDQGIITGYRVQLSPQKLDKYTTAFVLFKTNKCNDLIAFCESCPEIVDLHRISGEYNFLMKVITETTASLGDLLDRCHVFGFSSILVVLSTPFEDKNIAAILD